MPNHVVNYVSFECSPERVREIFAEIQGEEYGTIDFNKIIPMPPSLDIEEGSSTSRAIEMYMTSINPAVPYFGEEKWEKEAFEKLSRNLNSSYKSYEVALPEAWIREYQEEENKSELKHMLELGKTAVQNLIDHGAISWYDWCVKNWETKWNAYYQRPGIENELCFQTAWAAPRPILQKLSERYPDVHITHKWADEDLGSNCGVAEYEAGGCIELYTPDYGRESVDFSLGLWKADAGDYGLMLNRSGEYICVDADEYQVAELFGKKVLFSEGNVCEADIPAELFLYRLKKTDGTDRGCVITKEKVENAEEGYIKCSDEDALKAIDYKATMFGYMQDDFETKITYKTVLGI